MALTLKTKQLILRPISISDRESMVDTIMSDRDVMQWLPRSDEVSTLEGQREVASVYLKDFSQSSWTSSLFIGVPFSQVSGGGAGFKRLILRC